MRLDLRNGQIEIRIDRLFSSKELVLEPIDIPHPDRPDRECRDRPEERRPDQHAVRAGQGEGHQLRGGGEAEDGGEEPNEQICVPEDVFSHVGPFLKMRQ